jgi:WD40 repeat protein
VAVAVAPDSTWLASASHDGTVWIWGSAGGHIRAQMRVEDNLNACAWLGSNSLSLAGSAGLYLFGFLTSSSHDTNA